MPSLLLVRHGQASFGGDDYDLLSDRGREQAEVVHRELRRREVEPAVLAGGTMRRQIETAAPWVADGGDLRSDERWNEYDAAAVLAAAGEVGASLERPEGSGALAENGSPSPAEFQKLLDGALAAWVADREPVDGERWPEFRARVVAAAEAVIADLPRGGVGVVSTSGGPIAALCLEYLGLPDETFVSINRILVNGGITKLIAGASGVNVVSFNEQAHLEPGMVTYR